MYYDSHTHLNSSELFENAEKYIQNFIDIGGKGMVIVGASEEYNSNAVALVESRKSKVESHLYFKITLGLHPEILIQEPRLKNQDLRFKIQELKKIILDSGCNLTTTSGVGPEGQNNVVAVGECGIDLYYPGSEKTLDEQKKLFAMQCDLAQELNLPLVIHSRNGFDQTLDVLKNYKNLTIYFHCRGYGPNELRILNSEFRNLYVGFCGNVTYKKADDLRESLKLVGEDQLLLETDAPYLSPQIVRGTQNEPANVRYIYGYVTEFLGKEKKNLEEQIERNFKNLYKF